MMCVKISLMEIAMKKYRNEWKYICSDNLMMTIRNNIKSIIDLDSNSNIDGKYSIHSLYFDSYDNKCAGETETGNPVRYKWRIRYYEDNSDLIKLEKKEKLYNLCNKRTCIITKKQYDMILNNKTMELFWSTNELLVKEFCIDIITKLFTPKVIINYERIAFFEPILNIRITFDTNISASYEIEKFLTGDYIKYPLQESNNNILEVKFDTILPGHIKNLIENNNIRQTSFSKYYLGMKRLEEVIK